MLPVISCHSLITAGIMKAMMMTSIASAAYPATQIVLESAKRAWFNRFLDGHCFVCHGLLPNDVMCVLRDVSLRRR